MKSGMKKMNKFIKLFFHLKPYDCKPEYSIRVNSVFKFGHLIDLYNKHYPNNKVKFERDFTHNGAIIYFIKNEFIDKIEYIERKQTKCYHCEFVSTYRYILGYKNKTPILDEVIDKLLLKLDEKEIYYKIYTPLTHLLIHKSYMERIKKKYNVDIIDFIDEFGSVPVKLNFIRYKKGRFEELNTSTKKVSYLLKYFQGILERRNMIFFNPVDNTLYIPIYNTWSIRMQLNPEMSNYFKKQVIKNKLTG